MHVCNVEIRIEETLSLLKAKAVIREFYCSADQELFCWLRTQIFKAT